MSHDKKEVILFIAAKLKADPALIQESSYFMTDLGLSSLRSMELICDVEDHFGLRIPDQEVQSLIQVGDLIAFIEKRRGMPSVESRA